MDINAIDQSVVQATLAENSASVAANPPAPSPVPKLSQPAGGHQTLAANNLVLKLCNGYQDSFPIFQARICAWFKSPSFKGVTNFTETLQGTEHQISLLRLLLMTGLLPNKVLSIFLHKPVYERSSFRMWYRILKNYDPRGKDAIFEGVSTLYTLDQTQDESISAYMS